MTTFTAAFKSADTDIHYGATDWYVVKNDVTGETEEWGVAPPDDKSDQHRLLNSDGFPCAILTDDLWIDHDRSAFVSESGGEVNEVARAIRAADR